MNRLKVYLRTKGDINQMIKTYEDVFDAKIIKKTTKNNDELVFAYINMFKDINILIACYYENKFPDYGYSNDIVISLESKKDFDNVYQKIKSSNDFSIDYEPTEYEWGTTLTKAYDKWGNGWILEKRTS